MTSHETALEAAAKLSASLRERTQLRFSGNCKCGQCMLVPLETITISADALDFLAEKLRAYSLSPDVSGLVERLKYEAEAMRLAPSANGEEYDAGYIAAKNDAFTITQEALDALPDMGNN